MIGERLQHGQDQARVLTEPFPHYLGSKEAGTDQVVLVEYTTGPGASKLDVIPVDHLIVYWQII